jgi:hypothetical protein
MLRFYVRNKLQKEKTKGNDFDILWIEDVGRNA